jgi:ribosome-associated protein
VDEPLRVTARIAIPAAELVERFSRSGGPGGQHVNTSDTRVELSYDVARSAALPETVRARALDRLAGRLVDGVLTVTASDRRSQRQNRELARERLAETLRAAVAPPPRKRRPTKPSRNAVQARLDDKKRRGEVKRLRRDLGD